MRVHAGSKSVEALRTWSRGLVVPGEVIDQGLPSANWRYNGAQSDGESDDADRPSVAGPGRTGSGVRSRKMEQNGWLQAKGMTMLKGWKRPKWRGGKGGLTGLVLRASGGGVLMSRIGRRQRGGTLF